MEYDITGTVKVILDLQEISETFSKREVVLTTEDDKYPQDIKLEFTKEKCALVEKMSVGERLKVHFNVRGAEYKGRYFVNLIGWKVDKLDGEDSAKAPEEGGANVEDVNLDDMDGVDF